MPSVFDSNLFKYAQSVIQDLLALETKKAELEKQLGRTPTHEEWADYVGISVLLLYARHSFHPSCSSSISLTRILS